MNRHTPGPWYLHERDTDPPYGWKVLQGCEQGEEGLVETEIADTYEVAVGNTAANASLIAASPDLLAACESFIRSIETRKKGTLEIDPTYEDWQTVVFVIERAVAKARGGVA